MSKYYAGIGSRSTPIWAQQQLKAMAIALDARGWTARTGGAEGADQVFAEAVPAEVYLPWGGFALKQRSTWHDGCLVRRGPQDWAYEVAESAHPAWDRCSDAARALHARNVHQVLGPIDPRSRVEHRDRNPFAMLSRFVLCWTPDGAQCAADTSPETGGTGQAIRIADAWGIEVFNLGRGYTQQRLDGWLRGIQSFG